MTPLFISVFAILIGNEGGFTAAQADPGNWTGGKVGAGELRGTKFGISASAFPTLDIAALSLDDAMAIYAMRYWSPICGDSLPAEVALQAFDAAVNNGVHQASLWLQMAVGSRQDGAVGPQTIALVKASQPAAVAAEMLARRICFMASLPTWATFGLGWARRLASLPFKGRSL